jgi:mannan endo-1,4-beta-mannosidase
MLPVSFKAQADPAFQNFISVRGDQLMDGDQPFRFISFNIPNLLLVEDNLPFTELNAWRLPDRFEITDGLATVRQLGGTVVRTYSISVQRADSPGVPCCVVGPGKFNEEAFRSLDLALQIANEQNIRLIIPLVNNWLWMGGRGEYAGWRGKTKDDFWTDPQIIADFKETIRFVLTRTNTLTGVRYCDDKAILCWETGNELASPPEWTREIAACIKSLDHNHLVMDGFDRGIRPEVLAMPDVDIVTTHHYPSLRMKKSFAELIRDNAEKTKGKKAYIVGEFGFVGTQQMEDAMKAIEDSNAAGGLLWSLRFRDRDGGFYWHSEPDGANLYKAFHWPASPLGAAYDEKNLMAITRSNAFAIRGLPVPPVPAPAAPELLPIADAGAISWQGSVGATGYQVERAPESGGPWRIVADNVDEGFVQYHPLFADESVPKGKWFYRVSAKNESGVSAPSNVVSPVKVKYSTFVDELADFSKVRSQTGDWKITNSDSRKAKEDAHRAAGNAGDTVVYALPGTIEGFRVFTFFTNDISDLKFSISDDGVNYRDIAADRQVYFAGKGDYGYWQPVLYHAEKIDGGKFLKIVLAGETQIGRVEISHKADITNKEGDYDGVKSVKMMP